MVNTGTLCINLKLEFSQSLVRAWCLITKKGTTNNVLTIRSIGLSGMRQEMAQDHLTKGGSSQVGNETEESSAIKNHKGTLNTLHVLPETIVTLLLTKKE